jgi:hypothetical protein
MDTVDVVYVTTKDGTAEQATIDHYKDFMVENGVIGQAQVKTIDPLVSGLHPFPQILNIHMHAHVSRLFIYFLLTTSRLSFSSLHPSPCS